MCICCYNLGQQKDICGRIKDRHPELVTGKLKVMKRLLIITLLLGALACDAIAGHGERIRHKKNTISPSFLQHCAFVSVDIQESAEPASVTDAQLPEAWKEMGFSAEDVNAANKFAWQVALPNAVKVAETCRNLGIPRIFIHWGYLFEDAMDLDPDIRKAMREEYGTDYSRYSGHIRQPGSQPVKAFHIQPDDYVLPKAAQDAFKSCNIEFVLRNLGVKNIVFVGGHTNAGGCLGKTARSARRLGYKTLCIRDATYNARESSREKDIKDTWYTHVMTTDEFIHFAQQANKAATYPSNTP